MFHPNSIYLKKQKNKKGSGISDVIYKGTMKKVGVKGLDRLYPGEKHAPLITSEGLVVGNYIGPGTQAVKRAMRGDRGITPVDDLAMRHDALYSLAKTKKDIRLADEDFLRILKKGFVKDHPMNLKTGELGIASKYVAESRTGVKFPTNKELAMNNPNDEKLLNIVRMTDRMYGVQSGKGILDVLQKIINWLFGSKSGKVPKYDIPPRAEEPRPEEPRAEEPRAEEPIKNKCRELLAKHGIVDKRTFRRWALRNHPDKVSDDKKDEATELFKEVMNCMESEQIGEGLWDIIKGIAKDPVGALVQTFDHFGRSKTWKNIEDFVRTDSLSQEVIAKMDNIMENITGVVKDIPVVGEIAQLPFAGWEAYSKEFKQTDPSKIKPLTIDFLKGLGNWKIYQKLHPDIGDDWIEYTQREFGRLGATRYKAEIPRIVKDMLRRTKLYLNYLTSDIKKRLNMLNAESIRIVKDVGGSRGRAVVDAVKSNPNGVSQEFRILLGKEWDTKNPLLKELFDTVFPKTGAYSRVH